MKKRKPNFPHVPLRIVLALAKEGPQVAGTTTRVVVKQAPAPNRRRPYSVEVRE